MKVIEVGIGKRGVSPKTGKPWINYKITLEDGRKAGGFDPVRVGDEVTVTQNGEYLNYKVVDENSHAPPYSPHNEDRSEYREAPASAPQSPVARSNGGGSVDDARKHLMRSANLYVLCIKCVNNVVAGELPEVARTAEMFQAAVGTLFIEASKQVVVGGKVIRESFIESMPDKPLKSATRGEKAAPQPEDFTPDDSEQIPY